jgi:hypothetical protein
VDVVFLGWQRDIALLIAFRCSPDCLYESTAIINGYFTIDSMHQCPSSLLYPPRSVTRLASRCQLRALYISDS